MCFRKMMYGKLRLSCVAFVNKSILVVQSFNSATFAYKVYLLCSTLFDLEVQFSTTLRPIKSAVPIHIGLISRLISARIESIVNKLWRKNRWVRQRKQVCHPSVTLRWFGDLTIYPLVTSWEPRQFIYCILSSDGCMDDYEVITSLIANLPWVIARLVLLY